MRRRSVDVDPHADLLHPGQHPHQWPLDVLVQGPQPPAVQGLRQRRHQPGHGHGPAAGVLGRVGRGPGQVELARRRRIGRPDVEAEEAHGQVLQQVLRLGRVEQVGGDGGVEVEPGQVDGPQVERPHQLLGPWVEKDPKSAGRSSEGIQAASRRPPCATATPTSGLRPSSPSHDAARLTPPGRAPPPPPPASSPRARRRRASRWPSVPARPHPWPRRSGGTGCGTPGSGRACGPPRRPTHRCGGRRGRPRGGRRAPAGWRWRCGGRRPRGRPGSRAAWA